MRAQWSFMVRALGLSGLGLIFLAISPKFRDWMWSGVAALAGSMEQYSPISYAAAAAALVLAFLLFLRGSSRRT